MQTQNFLGACAGTFLLMVHVVNTFVNSLGAGAGTFLFMVHVVNTFVKKTYLHHGTIK